MVRLTEGISSKETHLEQSSQEDITSAFGGNVVQPKTLTNAKVFVSKKQKRKAHIGNDSSIESKKRKLGPSRLVLYIQKATTMHPIASVKGSIVVVFLVHGYNVAMEKKPLLLLSIHLSCSNSSLCSYTRMQVIMS